MGRALHASHALHALHALGRVDAAQVVHDQGHGQRAQHGRQRHQLFGLHKDLHMPAQPCDPVRQRDQHVGRGLAPGLRRDKVHAHPADAVRGQPVQLGIGHVVGDHGHAARHIAQAIQRIERAGVVRAIGRGRDHHGARGAQALLQLTVHGHVGLRRRARPVRRRRKARIEDVHVAVAGQRRQRAQRPVRAGRMRNGDGRCVHGPALSPARWRPCAPPRPTWRLPSGGRPRTRPASFPWAGRPGRSVAGAPRLPAAPRTAPGAGARPRARACPWAGRCRSTHRPRSRESRSRTRWAHRAGGPSAGGAATARARSLPPVTSGIGGRHGAEHE
ncbi:conserved hypothetical protein, partial [Ricinus communis]